MFTIVLPLVKQPISLSHLIIASYPTFNELPIDFEGFFSKFTRRLSASDGEIRSWFNTDSNVRAWSSTDSFSCPTAPRISVSANLDARVQSEAVVEDTRRSVSFHRRIHTDELEVDG